MPDDFDHARLQQQTGAPATTEQVLWGFKVLKKIVGADGLHPAELAGLVATMQQFGASPAMVAIIEGYDVKSVEMKALLAEIPDPYGMKRLLYAAVMVAWADGIYAPAERAAVVEVAKHYKITESTVAAIEHLVLLEQQAASLRLALLAD